MEEELIKFYEYLQKEAIIDSCFMSYDAEYMVNNFINSLPNSEVLTISENEQKENVCQHELHQYENKFGDVYYDEEEAVEMWNKRQ